MANASRRWGVYLSHTLKYPVSSASIHPRGLNTFVTGSVQDGWVRVHDAATGEEKEMYKGHHGPVHAVSYVRLADLVRIEIVPLISLASRPMARSSRPQVRMARSAYIRPRPRPMGCGSLVLPMDMRSKAWVTTHSLPSFKTYAARHRTNRLTVCTYFNMGRSAGRNA